MNRRIRPSFLRLFLIVLTIAALPLAADQASFDGHWQGKILTPGPGLEINVDLETADGALAGDISIPVQGLRDFSLSDVAADGRDVTFKIPGIPGEPTFAGTLSEDGAEIAGKFTQGGATFDFELARGDDPGALARDALVGFDAFLEQAVKDWNVPGLAIAVVAGGETVYARGFGWRDLEGQKPMTPDSLFAIGSTTKAMTATVLGMLVDEGKLDWDEPLTTYLPRFALADPVVSDRLTPRDLVTHRSGLPRHDLLWYNNNESTREEVIARLAHLELTADLRETFQYNNLMFMTAGYLAGHLAGTTWEELVRERLFTPLGMERSNFSVAASQQDADYALPYRENDDDALERIPLRNIDLVGPAGSVNSTVNEMSRWLLFNLRGGKVGERQLVGATTLADIHSPQMTTGATPERPEISQPTYGMGWMIDTYRGHRRVTHGGGIDGFVTSVMLLPDDDLGLVAFTNRGSGLPAIASQHAADRLLGLDPIDWSGEALARQAAGEEAAEEGEKKKEATRVTGTSPSHPLADYAGDYQHPGYGRLAIELDGESVRLLYNGIRAPLEHWHYDVWNGAETEDDPTFEDVKLLFRGDVDGQIASVEATLELRAQPIVFARQPPARLFDPEYLERFVGEYDLPGQRVRIELAGGVLKAILPGQPVYTLEPALSGRFTLAEVRVISVGFEQDAEGKVTKLVFYQPNGVFEAARAE
jgi:CubicO group peptidase (beta-lactamase class C family)